VNVSGYSLIDYGQMITFGPRMGVFAEAMKRVITPGCLVLEIGTGPGIMAIMACHMGAGHVIAIEPDVSIELGRKMAQANGVVDRITFVRDLSTDWHPEALADVVVSDIRGVMPLFEHHIPCIVDTRARLIKPGAIQIPGKDRIYAALVETPATYEKYTGPWLNRPYGVDMALVRPFTINAWGRTHLGPESVLSDRALFTTLDYHTITNPNARAEMCLSMTRPGTVHGVLMWSETELVPGIGHSNAPGEPEQVYGQAFFPLEQPVMLAEGARAQVTMAANLIDGDYVWSWSFAATDAEGRAHTFRQSSFKSRIPDPVALAPRAASHCPAVTPRTVIDARALSLFDGRADLSRLAAILRAEFPGDFATDKAALDHVANLSARYART
jgi:protein arginine N-methyltransferase 1